MLFNDAVSSSSYVADMELNKEKYLDGGRRDLNEIPALAPPRTPRGRLR
jgi:hypothetical protein